MCQAEDLKMKDTIELAVGLCVVSSGLCMTYHNPFAWLHGLLRAWLVAWLHAPT